MAFFVLQLVLVCLHYFRQPETTKQTCFYHIDRLKAQAKADNKKES
ncbi:hypothetical protein ACKLNO_10810 [Neisseriaceae bacterium B1]